jgi:cytoskeleton protein RodZ
MRGLTQAQAANQLNLKVSVIVQMETEQWDPKVAPTFMRGYLRSYARLLKLSEKEILQAYALQTAYLKQHPEVMKSFSHKTRKDAAENRFMLATYFVVVLLVGLFLVSVWQTHLVDEKPVSVLPVYPDNTMTQSEAVPSSVAQAQPSAQPADDQVGTPQQTIQSNSVAVESAEQAEPSALSQDPTPSAASAGAAEHVVNSVAPEQSPSDELTVSEQSALASPGSEPSIQNPASEHSAEQVNLSTNSALMGTITMQFRQGCWVGIEDRHGKRLAYQMYQAGQEAKISGEFPLKVTLGEPTAVTLQLNDSSIDLSQYQPGRVARLTFNGPN